MRKAVTTQTPTDIDYASRRYGSPRYLCCHNRITLVVSISKGRPSIHLDLQNCLHNDIGMEVGCMHHTNQLAVIDLDVQIPEKDPLGTNVIGSEDKKDKSPLFQESHYYFLSQTTDQENIDWAYLGWLLSRSPPIITPIRP